MNNKTFFFNVIFGFYYMLSCHELMCWNLGLFNEVPNHQQIGQEVTERIRQGGNLNDNMEFTSLIDPRPPLFGVLISDQNNEVLKDLLACNVDIAKPWRGWSALCVTAKAGAHKNLAILLDHIKQIHQNPKELIDTHMSGVFRTTALHHAAERCSCCVEKLLQCGADPNAKDEYNVTPLETAIKDHAKCRWNHDFSDDWEPTNDILRILRLLKTAGADFSRLNIIVSDEDEQLSQFPGKSEIRKNFSEMIETFKRENT